MGSEPMRRDPAVKEKEREDKQEVTNGPLHKNTSHALLNYAQKVARSKKLATGLTISQKVALGTRYTKAQLKHLAQMSIDQKVAAGVANAIKNQPPSVLEKETNLTPSQLDDVKRVNIKIKPPKSHMPKVVLHEVSANKAGAQVNSNETIHKRDENAVHEGPVQRKTAESLPSDQQLEAMVGQSLAQGKQKKGKLAEKTKNKALLKKIKEVEKHIGSLKSLLQNESLPYLAQEKKKYFAKRKGIEIPM